MKTVPSKGGKRSPRAETVDGYLATLPEDARGALAKLRKTIKTAAPKATEVISYQIPTFKHQGMLVGFAALLVPLLPIVFLVLLIWGLARLMRPAATA